LKIKSLGIALPLILSLGVLPTHAADKTPHAWVRVNQLGYQPKTIKVAVFISTAGKTNGGFRVIDARSGKTVLHGKGRAANAAYWSLRQAYRLDFSALRDTGRYYVECGGAKSPVFRIAPDIYKGTADFLLRYLRQQRCGYNPYLKAKCHQHDGYIVDDPKLDGQWIDVRGGWHDASDCLQYLATSATATYQLLFAWQQTPDKSIFKDEYQASGDPGSNGVPDILDEARWGLEWMLRMNPDSTHYYNQVADDRDHRGMGLPTNDKVDYGWGPGLGRPVYPVTGKPQGLRADRKNRSTGVASSTAKFASAFRLGAAVFKDIDPAFSQKLAAKWAPAYRYGQRVPGNNQTACYASPYFYEEDNWVDDMELAAATAYELSGSASWRKQADYWGQLEDVSPWMELGRARHYQYYPFINLGHYYLAASPDTAIADKYKDFMRRGLECLYKRAQSEGDPFLNGVPYLWCSCNFVSAALTQARLYNQVSGDGTYLEMEAALRDWLFGCNPWGSSFISGLPANGDSPTRTHSYVTLVLHDLTYGGLVDGPIERKRFESLLGIHLLYPDNYAPFQKGPAVYHDDPGDYSSDEPTMDGTASLAFYLSTLEKMGKE
jgi:hypothetical protein